MAEGEKKDPQPAAAPSPFTAGNQVVVMEPPDPTVQKIVDVLLKEEDTVVHRAKTEFQLIQMAKRAAPCLILLVIGKKEDILKTNAVMRGVASQIRSQTAKVVILSRFNETRIADTFFKLGCNEFVPVTVPVNTLYFKVRLHIKALRAKRKALAEKERLTRIKASRDEEEEETTVKEQDSKSRGNVTEIGEDIWLFRGEAPKRVGTQWIVSVEGPDPLAGEWVEHESEKTKERKWLWKSRNESGQDVPVNELDSGWEFNGQKPLFNGETGKWKFVGSKPTLSFFKKGQDDLNKMAPDGKGGVAVAPDGKNGEKNLERMDEIAKRVKESKIGDASSGKGKDGAGEGRRGSGPSSETEVEKEAKKKAASGPRSGVSGAGDNGLEPGKDRAPDQSSETSEGRNAGEMKTPGPARGPLGEDEQEHPWNARESREDDSRDPSDRRGENAGERRPGKEARGPGEEDARGKFNIHSSGDADVIAGGEGNPRGEASKAAATAQAGRDARLEREHETRTDPKSRGGDEQEAKAGNGAKPNPKSRSETELQSEARHDDKLDPKSRRADERTQAGDGKKPRTLAEAKALLEEKRKAQAEAIAKAKVETRAQEEARAEAEERKEAASELKRMLDERREAKREQEESPEGGNPLHAPQKDAKNHDGESAILDSQSKSSPWKASGGRSQHRDQESGDAPAGNKAKTSPHADKPATGGTAGARPNIARSYVEYPAGHFGNPDGVWERVEGQGFVFVPPELKTCDPETVRNHPPYWYALGDGEPPFFYKEKKAWLVPDTYSLASTDAFANLPKEHGEVLLKLAKSLSPAEALAQNQEILAREAERTRKKMDWLKDPAGAAPTRKLSAEQGDQIKDFLKAFEEKKKAPPGDEVAEKPEKPVKKPGYVAFYVRLADKLALRKVEGVYPWIAREIDKITSARSTVILRLDPAHPGEADVLGSTSPDFAEGARIRRVEHACLIPGRAQPGDLVRDLSGKSPAPSGILLIRRSDASAKDPVDLFFLERLTQILGSNLEESLRKQSGAAA